MKTKLLYIVILVVIEFILYALTDASTTLVGSAIGIFMLYFFALWHKHRKHKQS